MAITAIKNWRKSLGIKQAALAQMVGVSQTAVSRWENGLDKPSVDHSIRIREIIAQDEYSAAQIEIRKQQLDVGLKIMLDLDGMKQLATSPLVRELFPRVRQLENQCTADYLIEQAAKIWMNAELLRSIKKNEVAIITGVSSKGHLRGFDELRFKHRWSATFQRIFTKNYVYVCLEPSEPSAEPDSCNIYFVDDISR